jgi:predicted ATP-dependent endonuclease of OLD family
MRLKSVFIRFYKSFNYDHIRKIEVDKERMRPWECLNDNFYPFVEISIDPQITAVVGANESGKSHLLTAIEKGMTGISADCHNGLEITRKDFCRYSHFYQSTIDEPELPDFGFELTDIGDSINLIKELNEVDKNFDRLFLFRFHSSKFIIYISKKGENGFDEFPIERIPEGFLPNIFRIDSRVALPDSISIKRLIQGRYESNDQWQLSGRELSFRAIDSVPEIKTVIDKIISSTAQVVSTIFPTIKEEVQKIDDSLRIADIAWREEELKRKMQEFNLAYDLIFKIARISVKDIEMMYESLREGDTGIVQSVVKNINNALKKQLNLIQIWSQDNDFELRVVPRDHELNFVISDRTGREYSFDERSSGLRHFLSYYVQYLTHDYSDKPEILLMDEPDAFLSGEAQQDLLKVFQMFANPSQGRVKNAVPVQVIYVTHSPFLIDKNHSERVRALQKAEGSKGTRVISSASHNHYEPLRSAFGSFVGETTFISGCNLMVEGPADQILIAGAASYLRQLKDVPESQLINLNRITIVPCGGAHHVPYLVYLARGRDLERPAVIVMLDGDEAGNDARRNLGRLGEHPGKKSVLNSEFIIQLSDIKNDDVRLVLSQSEYHPNFIVLEDLIPLSLSILAARKFIKTVYDLSDSDVKFISEEKIKELKKDNKSAFDAIKVFLAKHDESNGKKYNFAIDKVGFARTVVDILPEVYSSENKDVLEEFEVNMKTLFCKLSTMQFKAEKDVKEKQMRQKVNEKIETFLNDYSVNACVSRDNASKLLDDIENDLEGNDIEASFINRECKAIRTTHNLKENLYEEVRDFDGFVKGLERLRNAQNLCYEPIDRSVEPRIKKREDEKFSENGTEANGTSLNEVDSESEVIENPAKSRGKAKNSN